MSKLLRRACWALLWGLLPHTALAQNPLNPGQEPPRNIVDGIEWRAMNGERIRNALDRARASRAPHYPASAPVELPTLDGVADSALTMTFHSPVGRPGDTLLVTFFLIPQAGRSTPKRETRGSY